MKLHLYSKEITLLAFLILSIISCKDSPQSKKIKNETKSQQVAKENNEAIKHKPAQAIEEVKNYETIEETNDWYSDGDDGYKRLKLARVNGKIGFLKANEEELFPCVFDSVVDVNNSDYRGLNDTTVPINKGYFTRSYDDNRYAKVKKDGKWGLITIDGKLAITFMYDDIYDFDYTKTSRMEGPYVDFWDYSGKVAVVKKGDKWGLINTQGEVIANFVYDQFFIPDVHLFYENRAAAKKDGKWGFLNEKGSPITSFIYDTIGSNYLESPMEIETFKGGLAVVKKDGKVGAIDINGKEKIPFIYDYISNFKHQSTIAKMEEGWGYINKNGEEIIPLIYDEIKWFENGLCPARKDLLWGFLNEVGEVVVPMDYEDILVSNQVSVGGGLWYLSQDGFYAVMKNGKWGLIDKANNVVTNFKYDSIKFTSSGLDEWSYFSEGYLTVRIGEFWSVINKDGVNHIPFEYDDVEIWSEGNICIKKNGKWGLLDSLGRQLVSIEHGHAKDAGNYIYKRAANKL